MIVGASVLVAALLRRHAGAVRTELQCLVGAEQREKAWHELDKHVASIVGQAA